MTNETSYDNNTFMGFKEIEEQKDVSCVMVWCHENKRERNDSLHLTGSVGYFRSEQHLKFFSMSGEAIQVTLVLLLIILYWTMIIKLPIFLFTANNILLVLHLIVVGLLQNFSFGPYVLQVYNLFKFHLIHFQIRSLLQGNYISGDLPQISRWFVNYLIVPFVIILITLTYDESMLMIILISIVSVAYYISINREVELLKLFLREDGTNLRLKFSIKDLTWSKLYDVYSKINFIVHYIFTVSSLTIVLLIAIKLIDDDMNQLLKSFVSTLQLHMLIVYTIGMNFIIKKIYFNTSEQDIEMLDMDYSERYDRKQEERTEHNKVYEEEEEEDEEDDGIY